MFFPKVNFIFSRIIEVYDLLLINVRKVSTEGIVIVSLGVATF